MILQVVCDQVQRLHGENRPHRVCDARPGVRLPPKLLLLLRVRPPAEEGRRVCPEGGSAAVQDRLREGEGLTQLSQPRWLRLRWALSHPLTWECEHHSGAIIVWHRGVVFCRLRSIAVAANIDIRHDGSKVTLPGCSTMLSILKGTSSNNLSSEESLEIIQRSCNAAQAVKCSNSAPSAAFSMAEFAAF